MFMIALHAQSGLEPAATYSWDFESGGGGFVPSGRSSWERGTPTGGPGSAHSGTHAWSTRLAGSYPPNLNGSLLSPVMDLRHLPQETPFIQVRWWQYFESELELDRGGIEISRDGGATWTAPIPEFSGAVNSVWTQQAIYLDRSWASPTFRLRFRFQSDTSVTAGGYFIDDLEVAPARFEFSPATLDSGGGAAASADGSIAFITSLESFGMGTAAASDGTTLVVTSQGFIPVAVEAAGTFGLPSTAGQLRLVNAGGNADFSLIGDGFEDGSSITLQGASEPTGPWTTIPLSSPIRLASGVFNIQLPNSAAQQFFRVVIAP